MEQSSPEVDHFTAGCLTGNVFSVATHAGEDGWINVQFRETAAAKEGDTDPGTTVLLSFPNERLS
jgi:hypothetical protein